MRAALMIATAGLASASAPPAERVVSGDRIVTVAVDGTQLRLRIDPHAAGLPIVTGPVAERLRLKGGGMLGLGVAYAIGHERIYGRTQVARFDWGAAASGKRRVGWMSRVYALAADGTIGPAGVPEPIVRFVLRPAQPGERTVALPMAGGSGRFGDWMLMGASITVGGETLIVRFDPDHPHSLATAPAAARLAAAYGGTLTAATARQEIAFGVERPLRVMALARPLAVGPLTLSTIAVRVTDGGGANTIPEAGADPNEVVVTGGKKQPPGSMTLGADQLDRCSSLVFDKAARQVRLTCG